MKQILKINLNELELVVDGEYTPPTKGDNLTAPTSGEFEIDRVYACPKSGLPALVDVTDVVNELNGWPILDEKVQEAAKKEYYGTN